MKKIVTILVIAFGMTGSLKADEGFIGSGKSEDIKKVCNAVATWQINNFPKVKHDTLAWTNAVLYRGMFEWAVTGHHAPSMEFLKGIGEDTGYGLNSRIYHADDICIGQTWIEMYLREGDRNILKNVQERAHYVASNPSQAPLSKRDKFGRNDRWSWCDALFMAAPVYSAMYSITKDKVYLDYMDNEYKVCTDSLYDRSERLFYRDYKRIGLVETNGTKQFWSRGNGWVFASIPLLLNYLPDEHPSRDFYEKLFVEMASSVAATQNKDGSWHTSMLNPQDYPEPENSGSALFCYGLAWGIRNGLLPEEAYNPVLADAWRALVSHVDKYGKLRYVQPVGASPKKVSASSTDVYGVGAFLLAGSEMTKLAHMRDDKLPSLNNQRIDGYKGIWYTLGQESKYGYKYSGGLGTYSMKHNPLAVYSPVVDRTYFVYGGTTAHNERHLLCMIGCYDHKSGMVQKPTVVYDKGDVDDPHDNPTLQMDKDGYLWVFVAGRSYKRKGHIYRSDKPFDISSFSHVNTLYMCYPQPLYDPDKGFFLFFTKYSGVRRLYYSTSTDCRQWSETQAFADIREEKEKKSGHYQTSACKDGKIVTAFTRHINGNVDKRTNLYFLQSTDWGKSWQTADGNTVSLPVKDIHGPYMVVDAQSEGKNLHVKDVNFDKNGNPVILFLTSGGHRPGPANNPREWQTAYWNGKKWEISYITSSSHNYDSGSIWTDNGKWTVIAPVADGPQKWQTGGEIVMWESTDRGRNWEKVQDITKDSPYNHGYVRRPLNAADPFYGFWADGNPERITRSRLYFTDSKGKVFILPYEMTEEWMKPEELKY